jgi:hypothetical protein
MQDHRLDVLRAVALDHECLPGPRVGQADIIALDRRAMQGREKKIATVSDGTSLKSYDIFFDSSARELLTRLVMPYYPTSNKVHAAHSSRAPSALRSLAGEALSALSPDLSPTRR